MFKASFSSGTGLSGQYCLMSALVAITAFEAVKAIWAKPAKTSPFHISGRLKVVNGGKVKPK